MRKFEAKRRTTENGDLSVILADRTPPRVFRPTILPRFSYRLEPSAPFSLSTIANSTAIVAPTHRALATAAAEESLFEPSAAAGASAVGPSSTAALSGGLGASTAIVVSALLSDSASPALSLTVPASIDCRYRACSEIYLR
jgi:hypothetical protein